MNKINDLRLKINEVDKSLLNLLIKRLKLVKEIGRGKRQENLKIVDKDREKEILNQLIKLAAAKGVSSEIIKKVWKVLMEISYEIEGGKDEES